MAKVLRICVMRLTPPPHSWHHQSRRRGLPHEWRKTHARQPLLTKSGGVCAGCNACHFEQIVADRGHENATQCQQCHELLTSKRREMLCEQQGHSSRDWKVFTYKQLWQFRQIVANRGDTDAGQCHSRVISSYEQGRGRMSFE